jgi:purine-nucleoside phosphorylase
MTEISVDRSRPIPPSDQPARLAALVDAVRARTGLVPRVGIVLGAGRLILGRLAGVPVVALQGRFHLYEGNAPGLVIQPVLLFKQLGATLVILTNAAGGANPAYGPGTLMVISDHINFTGISPLMGQNADELGERFTDLTDVWTPAHRAALRAAGEAEGVELDEGVYMGFLGPNYETPAEVRMAHALGADAVGMSTVLEAIAARWVGLEVAGVSLVTNAGAGYSGVPLNHEEVLEAGPAAATREGAPPLHRGPRGRLT